MRGTYSTASTQSLGIECLVIGRIEEGEEVEVEVERDGKIDKLEHISLFRISLLCILFTDSNYKN